MAQRDWTLSMMNARTKKRDEFYTLTSDISKEMSFHDVSGRTVYLNCDNQESGFWEYFTSHFYDKGLKHLIATSYNPSGHGTRYDVYEDGSIYQTPLDGDGSYDSPECLEILYKEAEAVITNPPFSSFRRYFKMLAEWGGKFLLVVNQLAFGYMEVFPYFKADKIWAGVSKRNTGMWFKIPDLEDYQDLDQIERDADGNKIARIGQATWMTNLEYEGRLERWQECKVKYDPAIHPTYDNYPAIDIPNRCMIPYDYNGVMGVPLTFIYYHNPSQFEIVGFRYGTDGKDLAVKGKSKFQRILLRQRA